MRRITVALLAIGGIAAGAATTTTADPSSADEVPAQQQAAAPEQQQPKPKRNGCQALFTRQEYGQYVRAVYRRQKITLAARGRLARMTRCQHSWRAERWAKKRRKAESRKRQVRIAAWRLTPYGGWAIPQHIVMCESRGSWHAANSSGARGPYQFLGWNVPWPVRSEADKLAHHRMAARLWNGGRGASHWQQCL